MKSESCQEMRILVSNYGRRSSKRKTGMIRSQIKLTCLLTCLICFSAMGIPQAAPGTESQGTGKRIVIITNADLADFRAYLKKKSFKTTDEQYVKAYTRLVLFAMEAEALGLTSNTKTSDGEDEKLNRLMRLSQMYIEYLESEYPVSDLVVESYYYAHPAKFPPQEGSNQGMNEEQKEEVRRIVRTAKKSQLARKAFDNLKSKYQVELRKEGNK